MSPPLRAWLTPETPLHLQKARRPKPQQKMTSFPQQRTICKWTLEMYSQTSNQVLGWPTLDLLGETATFEKVLGCPALHSLGEPASALHFCLGPDVRFYSAAELTDFLRASCTFAKL
eukprot:203911-Amphidinium_carterae.1